MDTQSGRCGLWRDTALGSKIGMFDSVALFPLVLFMLHIKLWTLLTALGMMCFLSIIKYYGFSVVVFFRFVRSWIAGRRKLATPWWL